MSITKASCLAGTTLAAALLVSAPGSSFGRDAAADPCQVVELGDQVPILGWAASAAWTGADRSTLNVLDNLGKLLVRLQAESAQRGPDIVTAHVLGSVAQDGGAILDVFGPGAWTLGSEAFRQIDAADRSASAVRFSGPAVRFKGRPDEQGRTLDSLYGGLTATESGFFAFADLHDGRDGTKAWEDQWTSAFVFIPRDEQAPVQVFAELDYRTTERFFYVRGDFIDAVGGVGYALRFSPERAWIASMTPGVPGMPKVIDLPSSFGTAPFVELPEEEHGATRATRLYRAFERSTMPAALLATDGRSGGERLAVLVRDPLRADGTAGWRVAEYDPASGLREALWSAPTRSGNLTVAPGPTWAFVERSSIRVLGPWGAPVTHTSSIVLMGDEATERAPSRDRCATRRVSP